MCNCFGLVLQISREFRKLAPVYQDVISDICRRMGVGMTEFVDKGPDIVEQWEKVSESNRISFN